MYQWEKSIGTYIISIQLCNQNWSDYHIQPAVPGKSKNKLLAIKVDENLLANLKSMDGWQDKVRVCKGKMRRVTSTGTSDRNPYSIRNLSNRPPPPPVG